MVMKKSHVMDFHKQAEVRLVEIILTRVPRHLQKNAAAEGYLQLSWASSRILPEVASVQWNEEHRCLFDKYDMPMDRNLELTISSALQTMSLRKETQLHSTQNQVPAPQNMVLQHNQARHNPQAHVDAKSIQDFCSHLYNFSRPARIEDQHFAFIYIHQFQCFSIMFYECFAWNQMQL